MTFEMSSESVLPTKSVNQLASVLAEVHVALAVATDPLESLAAVMRYFERLKPVNVHLHAIHLGHDARPLAVEALAIWSDGQVKRENPAYGTRYILSEFSSTELWINNPHELIAIEDVITDPRCDEKLRQDCLRYQNRAIFILPLFSVSHGAWQGVLSILWTEPHRASEEERFVCSMLMATLASFLANQRSERALRVALRDRQDQTNVMQRVLEHLPMGVVMVEAPSGRPILTNRKAVEVLGRNINQFGLKENYAEIYHCVRLGTDEPVPNEELPLVRALTTGEIHSGQLDVIGEDGQRRTVDSTAAPIADENGVMRNVILLMVDVTQRKRAEQERLRMQDELISMQAAALAERSTPLIPITDEIMIVPLIGSLDAERGNQLIDTLLQGVSQNRARVAIIDITGIKTLDTQAANTLTGAAQALRLLGVEPILTGIRAEVAQTLVTLGVRLDGISTRNNLQSGIALALKYSGRRSL